MCVVVVGASVEVEQRDIHGNDSIALFTTQLRIDAADTAQMGGSPKLTESVAMSDSLDAERRHENHARHYTQCGGTEVA